MKCKTARWSLGFLLPGLVLVLGLGPFLILFDELPARIASNFDLASQPTGSMTPGTFAACMGSMLGAGALLCSWISLKKYPTSGLIALLGGFLGGFFVSLGAGTLAWVALSQRGLSDWREASGPGPGFVGLIAVAILVGLIGAWLASQLPTGLWRSSKSSPKLPTDPMEPMELAECERAVWSGSVHNRWIQALGLLICVGAGLLCLSIPWGWSFFLLAMGFLLLALSGLHARADRSGLHIRYGLLRWPHTDIAIEQIKAASAIDVRPMEWGGWGYRGSLGLLKRAAVVLRAGPGIRIDLRDGSVFVVTIEGPETPAALLNAESQRLRSSV